MFGGVGKLDAQVRVDQARGPRPFANEVVVKRSKRGATVQERDLVHILHVQARWTSR